MESHKKGLFKPCTEGVTSTLCTNTSKLTITLCTQSIPSLMEILMKTHKKMGHSSTYEFLNKEVRESHKKLLERNKKMTPKELGMEERFEDVPERLSNLDKDYGKVNKISSSGITNMRSGSTFDE
tara:strand:+ start:291 stop:665 length:375 start_codon:yes stop_codon:yes gene_type:complete